VKNIGFGGESGQIGDMHVWLPCSEADFEGHFKLANASYGHPIAQPERGNDLLTIIGPAGIGSK
jgi:hypothetical protein